MDTNKENINLYKYLNLILVNKKLFIIVCSVFCFVGIILYFFVIDPIFKSTSTIKTNQSSSGGLGSLIGADIPDLGDISDFSSGGSVGKELALFENILLSRRVIESTIIKFKLNDDWEFKYLQDAVKHFRKEVILLKKDKIAGIIEIGIFDKNPVQAKDISLFMIDELNKINIELKVKSAKANREFLETRYLEVKNELKVSEDSLISFQNRFGISPDIIAATTLKGEIELESQIKSEEIKLELLKKILAPEEAEVQSQILKINALKEELNRIKTEHYSKNSLSNEGLPQVVVDFIRLKRNVEINTKILQTVLPMYESAKVEEKKETPTLLIIDQPDIPERKEKPKRIVSILIFTSVGFLITFIFLVVKDKYHIIKEKYSDFKKMS